MCAGIPYQYPGSPRLMREPTRRPLLTVRMSGRLVHVRLGGGWTWSPVWALATVSGVSRRVPPSEVPPLRALGRHVRDGAGRLRVESVAIVVGICWLWRGDGAAKGERLPGVEHRRSRDLKNRCEHAHRPTRQRVYRMQGLKSAGHAQRLLSTYGPMAQHFRPRRPLWSAAASRQEMRKRFASWAAITGTKRAASRAGRTGKRHSLVR
jgi:hypothetical protein